ncbi:hypothetical protein RFI_36829, partial [Reticulomyxa filosa]
ALSNNQSKKYIQITKKKLILSMLEYDIILKNKLESKSKTNKLKNTGKAIINLKTKNKTYLKFIKVVLSNLRFKTFLFSNIFQKLQTLFQILNKFLKKFLVIEKKIT